MNLRGKNGTVVYALSYFDCSAYFVELVRCAVTQSYEAHSEAMYIIDKQNLTPNEETLKKVAQIFEGLDSVKLLDFQKEAKELISSRYGI